VFPLHQIAHVWVSPRIWALICRICAQSTKI